MDTDNQQPTGKAIASGQALLVGERDQKTEPWKPSGCELIDAERRRQIMAGWSAEHDDTHTDGVLVIAATLLLEQAAQHESDVIVASLAWQNHPWLKTLIENHGYHPVEALVAAGALVAAEIDRLIRAERAANG